MRSEVSAPTRWPASRRLAFTGSAQGGLSLLWRDRRWRAGLRCSAREPRFVSPRFLTPRASAHLRYDDEIAPIGLFASRLAFSRLAPRETSELHAQSPHSRIGSNRVPTALLRSDAGIIAQVLGCRIGLGAFGL